MKIDGNVEPIRVVLPGEPVLMETVSGNLGLGPGLSRAEDSIVCTKAGVLMKKKDSWFVESDEKRYIPVRGENVVGKVTGRMAEYYRVDIGSAHLAILSFLAIAGATKKNRLDLNIGDLVYARISSASRDIEPELECTDYEGKSKEYGKLKDGFLLKCSLRYCRRLMSPESPIWKLLRERINLEVAIGSNGRVWFNSGTTRHTILTYNAIKRSETMTDEECETMVSKELDF
ncbi:4415_t:CDS:2 [Acaulospora morrowiae]|uniref:Ribosomal RNA-processing protein 40 n=1 Tax=Acaulospora morrowiae TaxID=94023 RepID=A0A9N8W6R8_9GLOM|nr:4415_t:CDS:2 [Acaulospora morrowiae]